MSRLISRIIVLALTVSLSACSVNSTAVSPGEGGDRSDRELILDAVLKDVLTNPELKDTRAFYGTEGRDVVALVTTPGYGVPWPTGYKPMVSGWTFRRVDGSEERDYDTLRLLGIRIESVGDEGIVMVSIFSAGGSSNGAVIGGCFATYRTSHVEDGWVVTLGEVKDP